MALFSDLHNFYKAFQSITVFYPSFSCSIGMQGKAKTRRIENKIAKERYKSNYLIEDIIDGFAKGTYAQKIILDLLLCYSKFSFLCSPREARCVLQSGLGYGDLSALGACSCVCEGALKIGTSTDPFKIGSNMHIKVAYIWKIIF